MREQLTAGPRFHDRPAQPATRGSRSCVPPGRRSHRGRQDQGVSDVVGAGASRDGRGDDGRHVRATQVSCGAGNATPHARTYIARSGIARTARRGDTRSAMAALPHVARSGSRMPPFTRPRLPFVKHSSTFLRTVEAARRPRLWRGHGVPRSHGPRLTSWRPMVKKVLIGGARPLALTRSRGGGRVGPQGSATCDDAFNSSRDRPSPGKAIGQRLARRNPLCRSPVAARFPKARRC